MKRALFSLVVLCCALVLGCGKSNVDMNKQLEKAHKTEFAQRPDAGKRSTPEYIAAALDDSHERANYLHQLATDEKFDPKQHVEMLKKYADDKSEEVSTVAKELLAKAQ